MSGKKHQSSLESIEQDIEDFEETSGEIPPICQQMSLRKTPKEKIAAIEVADKLVRGLRRRLHNKCGDLECPVCTKV